MPRGQCATATNGNGLTLIFGGITQACPSVVTDAAYWAVTGPTSPLTYTSTTQTSPPAALANHSLAPLPSGGHLLFGGTSTSSTQTLANGVWTTQFPTFNPAPRSSASLMLDLARGNNVMFGGVNPLGVPRSDTWTYANGEWTFVASATSPSARSEHRMAYDAVRQRGVLFGGKDALGAPLGDQWHWNGTTWAQATPATLPPARYGHGLAYDAARDRMVLHGGQDAAGLRDDLWESDGATWTLIPPVTHNGATWNPSARAQHGFAYDQAAERIVLHGGTDASGCQSDAWSWDGTDWLLHTTAAAAPAAPSARSRAQLVEDPASRRVLLFAGGCGTTLTNDLWRLDIAIQPRVLPYGTGCAPLSGAAPTLDATPGSTPRLGQPFSVRIGNLPPVLTPTFPFWGFSKTAWNGQPLPLNLAAFGLNGCTLDAALEASGLSLAFATPTTDWTAFTVPNIPAFAGMNLYFQALVPMSNAGNATGAVLTNALRVVVGS